jgi:hypothetical protein
VQQARGGRADTGGRAGDDHRLAGQVDGVGHAPMYTSAAPAPDDGATRIWG